MQTSLHCSIISSELVSHHNAVLSLNSVIGNPYSSFSGDPGNSDDSEFDSADDDEFRREDMFEDRVWRQVI